MVRKALASFVFLSCSGVAHAGDKPLYQAAPAWVVPAPMPDAAKLTDADPALVLNDFQQRVSGGQVWAYVDQASRVISPQPSSSSGGSSGAAPFLTRSS